MARILWEIVKISWIMINLKTDFKSFQIELVYRSEIEIRMLKRENECSWCIYCQTYIAVYEERNLYNGLHSNWKI